ncbi:hypothetical protein BGZ58_008120 [Dissophora ornata]|nr:hypothetical protein BGZ58_008120 [Dissophora ornata]
MRQHLASLRQDNFSLNSYKGRDYVLRGSLRTDGFRLQLLAFEMKELQSVRYKRLPENVLPPQITSTVGGVDYFLTEVRNVVKTQQDIAGFWGCAPEQIRILGLDLGQVYVVGASALLPKDNQPIGACDITMEETFEPGTAIEMKEASDPGTEIETKEPCDGATPTPVPVTFYNLRLPTHLQAPTLNGGAKEIVLVGATEFASDIESKLPPLRGGGANFVSYVTELEKAKERLY